MIALLRALQLSLRAADAAIDAVVTLADAPAEDAAPLVRVACPHPMGMRIRKAVMGHPTRFECQVCGQTVEVINGEHQAVEEGR